MDNTDTPSSSTMNNGDDVSSSSSAITRMCLKMDSLHEAQWHIIKLIELLGNYMEARAAVSESAITELRTKVARLENDIKEMDQEMTALHATAAYQSEVIGALQATLDDLYRYIEEEEQAAE